MMAAPPRPANVCLVGAAGRLGSQVMLLLTEHQHLHLQVVLTRPHSHHVLAGGVSVVSDPTTAVGLADVVIDCTAPAACAVLAPLCAAAKVAYLCCSTALQAADRDALALAASQTAVLQADNFSLGATLLKRLVASAAAQLPDFDVEIFELHHGQKLDAPSGTALTLATAAKQAKLGSKQPRHIGLASLRGGTVVGEHTVFFLGAAERLELTHRAADRRVFAYGAVQVAAWLVHQTAGLYNLDDMLDDGP